MTITFSTWMIVPAVIFGLWLAGVVYLAFNDDADMIAPVTVAAAVPMLASLVTGWLA